MVVLLFSEFEMAESGWCRRGRGGRINKAEM
jgi:hypothetical protein